MNPSLPELIPALVSYVTERGGYVTKTKLLKLLYLFDVEFYRAHGSTFTDLQWKFFHLGPWTSEFDPLLKELVEDEAIIETKSFKADYETKFYRASERSDLGKLFEKYSDKAILTTILDTWAESSTGEILDYVYFRTEPMEYGIRNQPLDFSRIFRQPLQKYVRTSSGKSTKEIAAARREIQESLRRTAAKKEDRFAFTPPKYDEEYFAALEKLENEK
jgi:hypothetical protein